MELIVNHVVAYVVEYSYLAVFILLLWCGIGFPLPEDVILIAAGYLVYLEAADMHLMWVVAMAGVLIGDIGIFFVGKKFGLDILTHRRFRKILSERRLVKIEKAFNRYGTPLVFFGRFMAFVRSAIYLSSGALGIRFSTFIFYDFLAAFISVPLVILVGFYFGDHIHTAIKNVRRVEYLVILFVLLLLLYFIRFKRGRMRKLKPDGQQSEAETNLH